MPAHFVLALMLAGILAVCFGIVLRLISEGGRDIYEDVIACAALAKVAVVDTPAPEPQQIRPRLPVVSTAVPPAKVLPSRPIVPEGWTLTQDGNRIRKAVA